MHGEGESPETMLMAWREAVPELGTEKNALDFLAAVFCINQLPFLEKKNDTKKTGRFK